jgi:hypothetical protein
MNYIYTFINVLLTFALAVVLLQIVPTLVSSDNSIEFFIGIIIALLGFAVVYRQGFEVYNDLMKGDKDAQ